MSHTWTFPAPDDAGLAVRINRWRSRWQQGGIEDYPLRATKAKRSVWATDSRIEISEQRIWLKGLPDSFSGLRIVQLSDIHHGKFYPLEAAARAVALSNALKPDLVALTGDFVSYSRACVEPVAEVLGMLRARYGVLAVLGNHDFRVSADGITRALDRQGIEVLRNRNVRLCFRGEELALAGVDDHGYGADLRRAMGGIPAGTPKILLAHNPQIIRGAARYGADLVLSGHTHGGQINFPVIGSVAYGRSPERLRYKIGWDRLADTQIYVSRGLGTIVLPWRLRCPAEIPHIELLPSLPADRHGAASPAAN
jgi:uncharacterized protein